MKRMKKLISLCLVVVMILGMMPMAMATEGAPETSAEPKVVLEVSKDTILVGDSVRLTLTVTDGAGYTLKSVKDEWATYSVKADENKATYTYKSIKQAGDRTFTATAVFEKEGAEDVTVTSNTVHILVKPVATDVKVSGKDAMLVGDEQTLTFAALAPEGSGLPNDLKWETSNEEAVVLTANGEKCVVKALASAEEPVTITVSSEKYPDIKTEFNISIRDRYQFIVKGDDTMIVGEEQDVIVDIMFPDGAKLPEDLKWSINSDAIKLAKEDYGMCRVIAVSATKEGEPAVVTASSETYPEATASFEIHVRELHQFIVKGDDTMVVGDEQDVIVDIVFPDGAKLPEDLKWSTDSDAIKLAKEDYGMCRVVAVSATKAGEPAVITASSKTYPEATASFEISIRDRYQFIVKGDDTMIVGEEQDVIVDIMFPDGAKLPEDLTWSTNSDAIKLPKTDYGMCRVVAVSPTKAGEPAVVTVSSKTYPEATASFEIVVRDKYQFIVKGDDTMTVGEEQDVIVDIMFPDGAKLPEDLKWSTDSDAIKLTKEDYGMCRVVAVNATKEGKPAVVTASSKTYPEATASFEIHISPIAVDFEVTEASLQMFTDKTALATELYQISDEFKDLVKFSYKSSDTNVVAVDAEGKLSAKNAGSATLEITMEIDNTKEGSQNYVPAGGVSKLTKQVEIAVKELYRIEIEGIENYSAKINTGLIMTPVLYDNSTEERIVDAEIGAELVNIGELLPTGNITPLPNSNTVTVSKKDSGVVTVTFTAKNEKNGTIPVTKTIDLGFYVENTLKVDVRHDSTDFLFDAKDIIKTATIGEKKVSGIDHTMVSLIAEAMADVSDAEFYKFNVTAGGKLIPPTAAMESTVADLKMVCFKKGADTTAFTISATNVSSTKEEAVTVGVVTVELNYVDAPSFEYTINGNLPLTFEAADFIEYWNSVRASEKNELTYVAFDLSELEPSCGTLYTTEARDTVVKNDMKCKAQADEDHLSLGELTFMPDVSRTAVYTVDIPFVAYCSGVEKHRGYISIVVDNTSPIVESGFCGGEGDGKNLNWKFTEDGVLYIGGSGKMADYTSFAAPWMGFYEKITKVVLDTGVTSIGSYAFAFCPNLYAAYIPGTVETIGAWAFDDCRSLYFANLYDGITEIAAGAFAGCPAITYVNLADTVTTIGAQAFQDTSLFDLYIPKSVTAIGNCAFTGINELEYFEVAGENTAYTDVDGVLFTADKKTLVCYPPAKPDETYKIPAGVTTISDRAFDGCTGLTEVELPDSVTSIGHYGFDECINLVAAYFQGNGPAVGTNVFDGCADGLTLHYINGKTGWTNVKAYNADKKTWNGYRLAVWESNSTAATVGDIRISSKTLSLEGLLGIKLYVVFDGIEGLDVSKEEAAVLQNAGVLYWEEGTVPQNPDDAIYGTHTGELSFTEGLGGVYAGTGEYEYYAYLDVLPYDYAKTPTFRPYIEVDGEYIYGDMVSYGVLDYCHRAFTSNVGLELKTLLATMLNYGSAAQLYFNENTDKLANADLFKYVASGDLPAEAAAMNWNANLLDPAVSASAAMRQNFAPTGTIVCTANTLRLGSMIQIKSYMNVGKDFFPFLHNKSLKVYFWNADDYAAIEKAGGALTKENATFVTKEADYEFYAGNGTYELIPLSYGIEPRYYGDTMYFAMCVTDSNDKEHCSGVYSYSPEVYAKNMLTKSTDESLKNILKWIVVYGEAAKAYFG